MFAELVPHTTTKMLSIAIEAAPGIDAVAAAAPL
jgi:hypothetical protein